MARRGENLRVHIVWKAKEVFLEQGFERASMDEIAQRAETSKRSLYAHFRSKENLFLAVVDLVRELYLENLGHPADYADDPVEALTMFLAGVSGHVLWDRYVRTSRLAIAEAERQPDASRGYYDVIVTLPTERIGDYLVTARGWNSERAQDGAARLLALTLYPDLMRVLFAVSGPSPERHTGDGIPEGADLDAIRAAVADVLGEPLVSGR